MIRAPSGALTAVFVFGVFLCGTARAASEDEKLPAFFKAYLEEEFQHRPLDATRLGDHRFDDRLDDVSPQARAADLERWKHVRADLPQKIDVEKLSPDGRIDFAILQRDLERSIWLAENTHPFEQDPRTYNGYITDSVYSLLTQSTLPQERNVKNAVARMALIPKVIAVAKTALHNPSEVATKTAVQQNHGAIGFYKTGFFELAGEAGRGAEAHAAAAKVVEALEDYQKFLENELLPNAHGDWRLGKEKFYRKLDLELDAGLTADDVLQEADREFDRVEHEMYVIARQLWAEAYPKKPLPPDDADGRRDTIRLVLDHFNKEHGKPEDLTRDARATVDRIKAFIADNDILRLPDPDRCQVIEMPEFQRGNSGAFLNNAPPLDPRATSIYAVSPPPRDWDDRRVESYLQEYNKYMIQILTIHEAYPGHYVQLEYSNRCPSLIRRVLFSGVFAEGWAVYTEQMMLDQGYGKNDPVLRLNQLKWYLRSVANAILDHHMHCDGMTDKEAMDFLTRRAFQSEGEAAAKIIRSKQSSCQLSTYFVGRTAFYRLRQQIEREQGDAFDLGRYHEAVLDNGTLPVKYLPELVRKRLSEPR
ncbi:MAG TPA: DUF885 domain-containing protein [Gemmataceae bacterium]|nr:DUF885 domain-containing protein [Gemmataceae bacterium]